MFANSARFSFAAFIVLKPSADILRENVTVAEWFLFFNTFILRSIERLSNKREFYTFIDDGNRVNEKQMPR